MLIPSIDLQSGHVVQLVQDAGFDPVVVGSLAQTRQFDLGNPLASRQFTAAEMRKALGR